MYERYAKWEYIINKWIYIMLHWVVYDNTVCSADPPPPTPESGVRSASDFKAWYKAWFIIMLIKPGRLFGHLISYLWLACMMECVRAVCTCHSLHTVCFLVCALFWLQGCWRCPIMSSIIPPVNMAKSSCPWEKLWKGECQYWQTNKFWQRGATFGRSVKATDMSL